MHVRSAFTLVEVMISSAILGTILFLTTQSIDTGSRLNERITLQTDLNNKANAVLNDLALELRTAESNDPTIGSGTSSLKIPLSAGFPNTYEYKPSNGIAIDAGSGIWTTQYDTKRQLVYDSAAGTLTKHVYNAGGAVAYSLPLCDQIANRDANGNPMNGFTIEQVGTTLRMNLTLQTSFRAGYVGEMIIHAADAQVIFMRSTLNNTPGASPIVRDAPGYAITGANTASPAPATNFGAKLSWLSTGQEQITLVISAPIGRVLNPAATVVTVGTSVTNAAGTTTSYSATATEGTTVSLTTSGTPVTIKRTTRTTTNGTQVITLTGDINYAITVTCATATTAGNTITESRSY
ncbi:MAG: prepilin-type N-terminal cleavage/methylation domain-containing protein [Planctomycetes bacterium]|nr:prepilin-type N-terminal cleavage/methylation domain-containing protein [Planctomycetota bacterium]